MLVEITKNVGLSWKPKTIPGTRSDTGDVCAVPAGCRCSPRDSPTLGSTCRRGSRISCTSGCARAPHDCCAPAPSCTRNSEAPGSNARNAMPSGGHAVIYSDPSSLSHGVREVAKHLRARNAMPNGGHTVIYNEPSSPSRGVREIAKHLRRRNTMLCGHTTTLRHLVYAKYHIKTKGAERERQKRCHAYKDYYI